jgi:toxin ParE1/3/4
MAHRLAPNVEAELDDIWRYLATASGNLEIADRVLDSITDRFFMLSQFPHIGKRRDEDLRPGLRSFSVGKYIIVYRIEEHDVYILACSECVSRSEVGLNHLLLLQQHRLRPYNHRARSNRGRAAI